MALSASGDSKLETDPLTFESKMQAVKKDIDRLLVGSPSQSVPESVLKCAAALNAVWNDLWRIGRAGPPIPSAHPHSSTVMDHVAGDLQSQETALVKALNKTRDDLLISRGQLVDTAVIDALKHMSVSVASGSSHCDWPFPDPKMSVAWFTKPSAEAVDILREVLVPVAKRLKPHHVNIVWMYDVYEPPSYDPHPYQIGLTERRRAAVVTGFKIVLKPVLLDVLIAPDEVNGVNLLLRPVSVCPAVDSSVATTVSGAPVLFS
jgi:hypothetical protein